MRILAFSIALLLVGFTSAAQQPQGHVNRWFEHASQEGVRDKRIGNEVLYQIFIDRFANGNPANDCLLEARFCDRSQRDWWRYWGGDLRGLIDRLPYLKELGVTRLWLTPIFDNQHVVVERERGGRRIQVTSYHGYWIRDWFRLNEFLTDAGKDDFAIVDELIAKGEPELRLLIDTVTNHTSPSDATRESLAFIEAREPLDRSDGINRTHRGALFRDGRYVTSLDEDEQLARGPDQSYRRSFHRYGPIRDYGNTYELEHYQLDGLTDIDQKSPLMASYMTDAHRFWLDRFPGLAGFRMDTIKHVSHDYWLRFDREVTQLYPKAEVVGEYFGGGPSNVGSRKFYRETDQTMFDFDFRYAVENVYLHGKPVQAFTRLWSADPVLGDARSLVTFVDNHDVPRLRGLGASYAAVRQATALMFASRGIPSIYYGLEQDLFHPNDPGDPYNRPMMRSFDTGHDMFRLVKTLSGLRKQHPALRWGKTHVVHESERILAFERVDGDDKVFFAMSTNPISGSDDFEMQGLTLPSGRYVDPLSGKSYEVRDGKVRVSLKRWDVIVLAKPR